MAASDLNAADIAAAGGATATQLVSGVGVNADGLVGSAAAQVAERSVKTSEKLRRLAATAVDPNTLAPWTAVPAWSTSLPVRQGECVYANGWLWVSQTGTAGAPGVTASSGAGPNTPYTNAAVADGTANWLAVQPLGSNVSDPLAPTVTRANAVPSAPNNVAWSYSSTNGGVARLYGGYQNTAATDRYRIATFDRSATELAQSGGGRIGFWSDAAVLTVSTPQTNASEGAIRILVDGRYLTLSGLVNASAANMSTTIDWTLVAGKKRRFYEIEGSSRSTIYQTLVTIYTSAGDVVEPPTTADDVRAYWIGDSQVAGHAVGAFLPGGGLAQRVARICGWNDLWNAGIGGTGYLNPGAGPYYTYRQRIAEGLTRNPDVWVLQGTTNDGAYGASAITAEALATYQAIRTGGSTAPIIVIGVEPINAGTAVVETALQAAVTQFADPRTFFVPLSNRAVPPIIGAYNRPATVPAAMGNVGTEVFVGDGTHLMERTIVKRAALLGDATKRDVLPRLP